MLEIKKITIISSYFAPAWAYGGPPKVLFTLAKALTKLGVSINVITTDSLGEKRSDKQEETIDGIKIYRLPTLSNTLAYKLNFFYAPQIPEKIDKILDQSDVVLFSDTRSVFNWQFYKRIKDKKIPYGVFAFGQIPRGFGIKSVIKKIFDLLWVGDFIKSATWRFAQTEHEREMYNLYFGIVKSDIDLLPLPIEKISDKPPTAEITQFRKKLNIAPHDKIILYVGRINYLKGIDILIKSIEKLLRHDKQIKLLIVGRDNGYLSSLLTIISDDIKNQIIFTGPLYGEKVNTAYYISSCFAITPRFYEETSLASLEALSFGVPVVTTQQADIPYLESYKAGLVVKNTKEDIQNGIKEILVKLKTDKNVIGSQAMKLIKEKYDVEMVAKTLANYLDNKYESTN